MNLIDKRSRKEKINSLKNEIRKLEKRKEEKDEFEELLSKRNKLKFKKLYAFGSKVKSLGSNISKYAEEQEKNRSKKENLPKKSSMDIYDGLFGGSKLNKQLGI